MRRVLVLGVVLFASTVRADFVLKQGGTKVGIARDVNCGTNMTCSVSGNTATLTSSGGGGGAPTNATYITQTADATLTNEQALSSLSTGLVSVTTGTGVLSNYAGSTCGANQYATAASAAGALTCSQVAYSQLTGAPTIPTDISGASYWTRSSEASLSNESNLSALSTGLVINTAGTPSAYAGTSCTDQFIRSLSASGSATCSRVGDSDLTGTISQARGGTGASNLTCPSGYALTSNGTAYSCTNVITASEVTCSGCVALGSEVTGILPIANGGTNSSATATNGGVGYGTGTAHAYTAAGTSGQVLRSAGAAAPTWGPSLTRLAVSGSNFTTTATTNTTITGLSWSGTSGTPYYFKCHLAATGTATGGPRFSVTSSGTSTVISYSIQNHTTSATTLLYTGGSASGTQTASCTASCLTTDIPVVISGMIVPSASVTLAIAAANSTSGQTTTVKVGSTCIVWTA